MSRDLPRMLTVREVAEYLQVTTRTVYEWTARGELPCIRISNRLRFLHSDVLRWVEQRKEG